MLSTFMLGPGEGFGISKGLKHGVLDVAMLVSIIHTHPMPYDDLVQGAKHL